MAFSSGPVWHEHRVFMLQSLSSLGLGKKDFMDAMIIAELKDLLEL
jgi:hypothetical protein